jgi:hypothetical protein
MNRSQSDSAYYPRRAGHFSWLWYRWFRLKQVSLWKRVVSKEALTDNEQILSLLLPGYVFFVLGHRRIGISILIGFSIAVLASLAAIGQPLATFCYCFMLPVQSLSILQVIIVRARGTIPSLKRIGLAFLLIIGLSSFVYAPLYHFVRVHIVVPLETSGGPVLVNPRWGAGEVQVGDVVAYQIDADRGAGYRIQEGVLYGKILAAEGDRIVFFPDHYELNGTAHVSQRWMPSQGGLTIEPDFWFIWADLKVYSNHGRNFDVPALLLSRTAIVSKEQFVGKLYRNWFGRDQSRVHLNTFSRP